MDAHRRVEIDAVVVDEALGLEAPVLPFREALAQPRFRQLEQAVPAGQDLVAAVFADELAEPLLAQPIGAELAANVAQHQLGRAAVGRDDALDVGARLERALIAHGRKVQAFVEGLPRLARAAARHRPADVALVGDAAAEADELAGAEHRAQHRHVGRMRAAALDTDD